MSDNQKSSHATRLVIAISVTAGLASIATLLFGDNLIGRLRESTSETSQGSSNATNQIHATPEGANTATLAADITAAAAAETQTNLAWDSSSNQNVTTEGLSTSYPEDREFVKK